MRFSFILNRIRQRSQDYLFLPLEKQLIKNIIHSSLDSFFAENISEELRVKVRADALLSNSLKIEDYPNQFT